jgi:hypothetical protein
VHLVVGHHGEHRVVGVGLDVGAQQRREAVAGVGAAAEQRGHQAGVVLFVAGQDQLGEDCLLRREMGVQRGGLNGCFGGDVTDRGPVVSVLGEQPRRGEQDPAPGALCPGPRRQSRHAGTNSAHLS